MSPSTLLSQSSFPRLGFGIGLRARHYHQFLQQKQPVDWLEIHTENYFDSHGWDAHVLEQLRRDYAISLHGVGLGIGSAQGFSNQHLIKIKNLVNRIQPALVSEHLCWGAVADRQMNDLLPLPLTPQALAQVCDRVDQIQEYLGRTILLENVSTFLRFRQDTMSESEFLSVVAQKTSCGILLDVNNLFVNQANHNEDAETALALIDANAVAEIHLAGHLVTEDAVIDHHGDRVADTVWQLYQKTLQKVGPVSTLIEWDTDVPELGVLLGELNKAREIAHAQFDQQANTPSLESTQTLFCSGLFDRHYEDSVLPLFNGEPALIAQRFALYRGNLSSTWEKVLAAAYPVIKQLLGPEFFEGLTREYGKSHPSQSGDLNQFGADFSAFLSIFPHVQSYAYLPDMARLEWGLHRAHFAPEVKGLDAGYLLSVGPQQMDRMQLTLHPACQLFQFDWLITDLWRAHQTVDTCAFPEKIDQRSAALITRPRWKALVLPLNAGAYAWLSSVQQGQTLGIALDAALHVDPAFDFAATLLNCLEHAVFVNHASPLASTNFSHDQ